MEARVASPGIIDCDVHVPQIPYPLPKGPVVVDLGKLGELQNERSARSMDDRSKPGAPLEHESRCYVEREERVAGKRCYGGQRGLERHRLEVESEPDRHRLGEPQIRSRAVIEPSQCLIADDRPRLDLNDGLKDGMECSGREGGPQPLTDRIEITPISKCRPDDHAENVRVVDRLRQKPRSPRRRRPAALAGDADGKQADELVAHPDRRVGSDVDLSRGKPGDRRRFTDYVDVFHPGTPRARATIASDAVALMSTSLRRTPDIRLNVASSRSRSPCMSCDTDMKP